MSVTKIRWRRRSERARGAGTGCAIISEISSNRGPPRTPPGTVRLWNRTALATAAGRAGWELDIHRPARLLARLAGRPSDNGADRPSIKRAENACGATDGT